MVAPTEISEVVVASLILFMGMAALGFGVSRWKSGDRTAVWFGLFAALYAARLAGESELVQPALPEVVWRYWDAFVTYIIVAPLALFLESLFGPGWRSSLRRTWQAILVYASFALIHDLVSGRPGEAALWLNPPVVMVTGAVAVAHAIAFWRRQSLPREFRVAFAGGLLFLGVAAYQTLGGALELEPFAMLLFLTAVAYSVAQRMLAGERRLVAVSREMELARKIQQSILPRSLPTVPGLRVGVGYLPMSQIGGDFYDFDTHHPGQLGIIVADVSGHGVPAALVASMVKMAFAGESGRIDQPGQALTNINRTLCDRFEGAYVTACCAFIDPVNLTLTYSSAGHPAPLLRRRGGRVESLREGGLLLAFEPQVRYASAEVALRKGDRIVFFSDGLAEASNVRDEFFGDTRLGEVVASGATSDPAVFVDQMVAEMRRWMGPETALQDDVTLVVVDVGSRVQNQRYARNACSTGARGEGL
jgi:sigma-B regulation protein RsbU (phosphoserine phosphatase)